MYKNNLKKLGVLKREIKEEEKKNEIIGTIRVLDRKLRMYQERSFSTSEVTRLLDRISELTKKVGVEIETFNPLNVISKERYIELPAKISVACTYHQLGKLLALMESDQELIWVKQLEMQKIKHPDPEKEGIARVDLIVSGLYLAP